MCQHHKSCTISIVVDEEIRESFIREMPDAAHYPLFHRPGGRSDPQHFEIVIRFHHQHVATAQMIAHADRHVSQVGGNADLAALNPKSEAHWVSRVMREGEGLYFDVANLELVAGFESLHLLQLRPLAFLIADCPCPGGVRCSGHEDGDV